ncbi:hypothetical protein CMV_013864 [Castanea mollissima]|uniref:Secreted protein n=1 Tax=Castanea mollissima TaxID=60419 RepID=A0A8J4VHR4_9ROSI|nr:hypothetical protein CMV_013864 [Castanea mollissima]
MLAMMIWVIITLVEANTNDHTATPNDLVEPDYIAEVKYIHCLIYTFESCQNYYKESNNLRVLHIILSQLDKIKLFLFVKLGGNRRIRRWKSQLFVKLHVATGRWMEIQVA